MAKKRKKKHSVAAQIVVFAIIVTAVLAAFLNAILKDGNVPAPEADNALQHGETYFEIHFLDVGQADCALVLCDGESMLIDAGTRECAQTVYSYLKEQKVTWLDYVVASHAHEDHIGGFPGAFDYATAKTVLCPVREYDSEAFETFLKCLDRQKVGITIPKSGESFKLGSAEVEILAPLREAEETNNSSIVLRIVYGQTAFLFTGDAEREEEQDILAAGRELSSTVLKVGHHGGETSTTYPFLREIMPEYAVISVGENNPYAHPGENLLSRLRDADSKVFRTDINGTIICKSDGKTVTFSVEKN